MRIKDFFSIERYKSVLTWFLRWCLVKLEGKEALDYEQVHIIEQYMFRIIQCRTCVNAGKCEHCGCHIPEKMWVRHDYCSNSKWGPFMDEDAWEKHKQKHKIIFSNGIQ